MHLGRQVHGRHGGLSLHALCSPHRPGILRADGLSLELDKQGNCRLMMSQ